MNIERNSIDGASNSFTTNHASTKQKTSQPDTRIPSPSSMADPTLTSFNSSIADISDADVLNLCQAATESIFPSRTSRYQPQMKPSAPIAKHPHQEKITVHSPDIAQLLEAQRLKTFKEILDANPGSYKGAIITLLMDAWGYKKRFIQTQIRTFTEKKASNPGVAEVMDEYNLRDKEGLQVKALGNVLNQNPKESQEFIVKALMTAWKLSRNLVKVQISSFDNNKAPTSQTTQKIMDDFFSRMPGDKEYSVVRTRIAPPMPPISSQNIGGTITSSPSDLPLPYTDPIDELLEKCDANHTTPDQGIIGPRHSFSEVLQHQMTLAPPTNSPTAGFGEDNQSDQLTAEQLLDFLTSFPD
ncbi:MAG: hypothetical protein Q8K75_09485 [Chlamydiales bacterium]|nr:hypothetical protein [Chlamydiales bacterium]